MKGIGLLKKKLLMAETMIAASRRQKRTTMGLMRIDGAIALTEEYLKEAKEILMKIMDEHEKMNSEPNDQRSVATKADSSNADDKQTKNTEP